LSTARNALTEGPKRRPSPPGPHRRPDGGFAGGSVGHATYTSSWIAPKADVHSQQRWFYMGHSGEVSVDQACRGCTVAAPRLHRAHAHGMHASRTMHALHDLHTACTLHTQGVYKVYTRCAQGVHKGRTRGAQGAYTGRMVRVLVHGTVLVLVHGTVRVLVHGMPIRGRTVRVLVCTACRPGAPRLHRDQAHRGYTVATDGAGFGSVNPLFWKPTRNAVTGEFAGQRCYGYLSFEVRTLGTHT